MKRVEGSIPSQTTSLVHQILPFRTVLRWRYSNKFFLTMKFNILNREKNTVINHAGAKVYTLTPAMELYTNVVTSILSDNTYEKADARLARIQALIRKNDAQFVAKLAVYAREKMYLRSMPLVLLTELAQTHKGDNLVSRTVGRVIQRADEITELLACYQMANKRKETKKLNRLSKQIQKGLADAFNKFDEYQFSKYNRTGTDVKLRDALFLVHPKAKNEAQQLIFNKIAKDELATAQTWETTLSAVGQNDFDSQADKLEAKSQAWEQLILNGKLGYMAMLRNLRNIIEANVSQDAIEKVCTTLSNARAVANAKQFPFRFLSAYREVKQLNNGRVSNILSALETAVQHSANNIRGFDASTRVVIAADVSGSMQKVISPKSTVQNFDIGLMLAMLLQNRCQDVVIGMFGDTWKIISVPKNNILANVMEFHRREGEVGYSTNGHLVIQDLINRRKKVDKIMIFTDCQLWNSNGGNPIAQAWAQYKKIAPNARLYLFDLAGYGNTPVNTVNEGSVFLMAGWSDKIFDILAAIEEGSNAIAEINKIEI
jgi:60 kDa SS-A/Ro ribonucleoprotein